jgi:hypothetical protein
MMTYRPVPFRQIAMAVAARTLLVTALLLVGCNPPPVQVQIKYSLAPQAACSLKFTPPTSPFIGAGPGDVPEDVAKAGPEAVRIWTGFAQILNAGVAADYDVVAAVAGSSAAPVCTWVHGDLDKNGNGFVDGPAKVDVYIEHENPFCTSYKASLTASAYSPPPAVAGAIYGAPISPTASPIAATPQAVQAATDFSTPILLPLNPTLIPVVGDTGPFGDPIRISGKVDAETGFGDVTRSVLYGAPDLPLGHKGYGLLDGKTIILTVNDGPSLTLPLWGRTGAASKQALLAAIHRWWPAITATIDEDNNNLTLAQTDLTGSILVGKGTANPLLGLTAGTDVRDAMATAAASLKDALTMLRHAKLDLNDTATKLSGIAQECKAGGLAPAVLEARQMAQATALQPKQKKADLAIEMATVRAAIDSTDSTLLSAPTTVKRIEAVATQQQNDGKNTTQQRDRYKALLSVAERLGEEADKLTAERDKLRTMWDEAENGTTLPLTATTNSVSGAAPGATPGGTINFTIQPPSGTQVVSLVSVAKDLDSLQAAITAAGKPKLDPNKSQSIDTYQTVTVDLADQKPGGKDTVRKVTLHTLSPLYVDVGLGPAWIFNDTQTWSISSAPGATVGTVTHSNQPNFDGVVSLSGYVCGPRYYDGSLRIAGKKYWNQWCPRPMLGLSMKSAFSSVYMGWQFDPIQFIDITGGFYFYSRPEPVGALPLHVVPSGTLATENVFAYSGFISITSSVNLFASWITGLPKSQ